MPHGSIVDAELVVPAPALAETVAFFTETLGMAALVVFPADDPQWVTMTGAGLRLRLDRRATGDPGCVRVRVQGPASGRELVAPNGTRVVFVPAEPPVAMPVLRPGIEITRADDAAWTEGRAGMRYRDLVPSRFGGRYIASHIRIPHDGPVSDWVHYHRVHGQLIFCARGRVELLYEDQGPAFVMSAGDCVLQPPGIRHRVLHGAGALEVIELSTPADHETWADPAMTLPTAVVDPDRVFGGQRFVHHRAETAPWIDLPGARARDLQLRSASAGVVDGRVVEASGGAVVEVPTAGELWLCVVLRGTIAVRVDDGAPRSLGVDDAIAIAPAASHRTTISASDADAQWLELSATAG